MVPVLRWYPFCVAVVPGGTRWYSVVPGGTLVFIGWYPPPRLGLIIIITVGVGGRRYGVVAPNGEVEMRSTG